MTDSHHAAVPSRADVSASGSANYAGFPKLGGADSCHGITVIWRAVTVRIDLEGGRWNQYPPSFGRGLVLVEYLGACAWRRLCLPTRQTLPPEWL